MKGAAFFGLILAGVVAGAAASLQMWESRRQEWMAHSRPERISRLLRQTGMRLLWFEAFLIAVGSLLPTEARDDRILFVSVWGLAGLLTTVLVGIALVDSLLRLLIGRSLAAELSSRLRNRTNRPVRPIEDDESDPREFDFESHNE